MYVWVYARSSVYSPVGARCWTRVGTCNFGALGLFETRLFFGWQRKREKRKIPFSKNAFFCFGTRKTDSVKICSHHNGKRPTCPFLRRRRRICISSNVRGSTKTTFFGTTRSSAQKQRPLASYFVCRCSFWKVLLCDRPLGRFPVILTAPSACLYT